jgi:hypothetical protein
VAERIARRGRALLADAGRRRVALGLVGRRRFRDAVRDEIQDVEPCDALRFEQPRGEASAAARIAAMTSPAFTSARCALCTCRTAVWSTRRNAAGLLGLAL